MLRRLWVLLMAAALVLAACGGDDAPAEAPEEEAPEEEPADDMAEEPEEEPAAADDECGPDHPALFEPGQLTIATGDPVFPPWMMDDDPYNGEGFESAVAYALAAELGFETDQVEWVRTTFDEAIAPGGKPYDFNMQQYSITEERREVVDFSVPYYVTQKALITFPDNPAAEAQTLEDLAGLNFGATIGTTDLDYIENVIGATDVDVFDDQAATFLAMEGGTIDATVAGLPTALFATAVQVPDATIAAILPGDSGDAGLGLLFAKDNELVACVDAALESLRAAGTLDALATEWLASDGEIREITG